MTADRPMWTIVRNVRHYNIHIQRIILYWRTVADK